MAPGAFGTFETIHTGGADAIATSITHPPRPTLVILFTTIHTGYPHKPKGF